MAPQPGGLSRRARARRAIVVRVDGRWSIPMTAGGSAGSASPAWTTRIRSLPMPAGRAIRSSIPRSSAIRPGNCSIRPNCRRRPASALCSLWRRGPTLAGSWRSWISSNAIIRASARWCSWPMIPGAATAFRICRPTHFRSGSIAAACSAMRRRCSPGSAIDRVFRRITIGSGLAQAQPIPTASGAMRKSGRRDKSTRPMVPQPRRRPSPARSAMSSPSRRCSIKRFENCRPMCRSC